MTPSYPGKAHGHVAILTLNRPDSMNALGAPGDGDAAVAATCEEVNGDDGTSAAWS